jgi:glyoxylase-like metal-dependent hydrolase (beta-lactamase superfamily II)
MEVDRRAFLLATAAMALTGAGRNSSPTGDKGFARVTRLGDGVYVTIANPKKGLQCYSNGGVIAGRQSLLIVEGHFQAEGAALEIETARRVSTAPIRGVVNTHWHLDHTFGNVGYAREQIPILAHEQVARLMQQRYRKTNPREREEALQPWEHRLADAHGAAEKAHAVGDLAQVKWILDSVNNASLAFPSETLSSADLPKTIDLGGLSAVIEFHPGHSQTDLIIRVPERDVVFTGDLFFNHAYPVVADSDLVAWRRVVDLLATFDPRTRFIPGHGAIGRVDDVRLQAALMDDLRGHADRMMQAGATAEEAERRYQVPPRFRGFDLLCWAFTVGGAMKAYFANAASRPNQLTVPSFAPTTSSTNRSSPRQSVNS